MNTISISQAKSIGDWDLIILSHDGNLLSNNFVTISEDILDRLSAALDAGSSQIILGDHHHSLVIKLPKGENPGKCSACFRKAFYANKAFIDNTIHVEITTLYEHSPLLVEALLLGFLGSGYSIKELHDHRSINFSIHFNDSISDSFISSLVKKITVIAQAQQLVSHWVNLGPNEKFPGRLMDLISSSLENLNVDIKTYLGQELLDNQLYAIHAVGKASVYPPGMLTAEYIPLNPLFSLTLVGKGVTFDTGGISIKSSSNMHFMKSDMAGAAMMAGVFYSVVKLQLPVRIALVLPFAENTLSGNALKPGDIIQSHAAKSIEIIDTDAEGRLLLADALSYASKHFPSDILLDAATLTGSSVATLGYEAAALFSKNDNLCSELQDAGYTWNEKLWSLPLWDEYKEDLHSDVADLRNYSGKPVAGAITAAKFLEEFTQNHPAFAHLDIAGVAFKESEFGKMRNATGFGVKLVLAWLESKINELSKSS
jgi:leucyl aminopeptidase